MGCAKARERLGDILIFAEDVAQLSAVHQVLAHSRHRIVLAAKESDALEKARSYSFHLIIVAAAGVNREAGDVLASMLEVSKNEQPAVLWVSSSSLVPSDMDTIYGFGITELVRAPWTPHHLRSKVDLLIDWQLQRGDTERLERKSAILAQAATRAEDRFGLFMDQFDAAALIVVDLDGRVCDWNKGAQRILGFSKSEMLGAPLAALYCLNECANRIPDGELAAVRRGESYAGASTYRGKNGRHLSLDGTTVPFCDENGRLEGAVKMLWDSSSSRIVEEEVRDLRLFFENAVEIFCISSPDGRFRRINPAFEHVLGYSPEEVVGRHWFDFLHPGDQEISLNRELSVWGGVEAKSFENRYRHKDGSYRWLSWSTRTDRARRLSYCVVRDVTESKIAEDALRESESHLRLVMDAAPLLISYVNQERKLQTSNRAHEQWFDARRDEIFDRSVEDIFGPHFYCGIEASIDSALAGREMSCEFEVMHCDGSPRFIHATQVPDFDEHGVVRGCFSFIIDKTAERNAEQQARNSHKRLESTLMAAKIVSWEHDYEKDLVTWVGDAASIYGMTPSNFNQWFDLVHPEDRELLQQYLHDALTLRDAFEAEFRVIWPDQSLHWLESKGKILWQNNLPRCLLGISSDISERKRAENALRSSEARFRQLAESTPQLVWIVSADGKAEYLNPRGLQFTGLSDAGDMEPGLNALLHVDDRAEALKRWREATKTQKNFSAEFRIRSADGSYRWHLSRAVPLLDQSGHVSRWLGTSTDIHDQKTLQEALARAKDAADAANQLKSDFLANMSHEIRTPLGAIMGYSELLFSAHATHAEKSQYIETIKRNGKLLSQIIDDILDLSKVEAGKLLVESAPCELDALLADVATLLGRKAQEKNIYLSIVKDGEVPKFILSDSLRLKQILINIVGNAVKFTSKGGVDVKVSADFPWGEEAEDVRLHFEVRDSGLGIELEQQARIFQPFSQADASTTRKFGGTGLGLILSRRLAQALGGDVVLRESAPRKGSSFEVSIRAGVVSQVRVADDAWRGSRARPVNNTEGPKVLAGVKALVVDDAPDNQVLLRQILRGHGAEVDLAGDGEEAVHKACGRAYDIVLMDLQMPVCDGFEATRILRRCGYDKPILAVSAAAMKEERKRAMDSGCNDHLTKPVGMDELVKKVLELTAARREREILLC